MNTINIQNVHFDPELFNFATLAYFIYIFLPHQLNFLFFILFPDKFKAKDYSHGLKFEVQKFSRKLPVEKTAFVKVLKAKIYSFK